MAESRRPGTVTSPWRRWAGRTALALYLTGFGFLCGVAIDRIHFDARRQEALARLDAVTLRVHARLMELEHDALLARLARRTAAR